MPIRNRSWLFSEEYISKVPEGAGVYELCNMNREVVFIGCSKSSIASRLKSHKKTKKCIGVRYFRYRRIRLDEDAEEEKKKLINAHIKKYGKLPILLKKPPKNIAGDYTPWL
jgi:hypothetical protein